MTTLALLLNQQKRLASLTATFICSLVPRALNQLLLKLRKPLIILKTTVLRLGAVVFGSILREANTGLGHPPPTVNGMKGLLTRANHTLVLLVASTPATTSGRTYSAVQATATALTCLSGTPTTTRALSSVTTSSSAAGPNHTLNSTWERPRSAPLVWTKTTSVPDHLIIIFNY